MRKGLLVAVLAVTACIPAQGTRPEIGGRPGDGGRELPPGVTTKQPAMSSKKVTGKEDPNILLAADQTRCMVSADKFRETAIGEAVFCVWSK